MLVEKHQLQSLKNVACPAMPHSFKMERGTKLIARCEAKQKWIRNKAYFLINVSVKIK